MTTGSPTKIIIRFAIPMMLSSIVQQLYSVADSVIVGQFVGKNALAAIGATQAVIFLMVCLIIGLTMGTCIIASQLFGAKEYDKVKNVAGAAIYISFGAWILIAVLGLSFAAPILRALGTPDEIFHDAWLYLIINMAFCLAPITYNMAANIMRSLGDSKSSLYALIVATIVNIVLDLIFVLVFGMGVAGTGIATVISQFVSTLLCLYFIKKKHEVLHIGRKHLKPHFEVIGRIIAVGIPMSLQNLFTSLGMIALQSIVNRFGTDAIAAYTAAGKIDQIALMPLSSLGMAVSTFTGQNYGSRNYSRIREGVKSSIKMAVLVGVVLVLLIFPFRGFWATLFVSAKETAVIAICKEYLGIVSIFYWLAGVMYVFLSMFRGMGRMVMSTISAGLEPLAKIIAASALAYIVGRGGIWFAWPIGWFCAVLIPLVLFITGRWSREKAQ